MSRPPRVLAVASGGGHWKQLMRLEPALRDFDVAYVTVGDGYRSAVAPRRFYTVADASRWTKFLLVRSAAQMLRIVWRERPDVVISTGAAPGLFAVLFGRLLGARTVWLDSMANVERMSLSGRIARPFSTLWLTQWPHLANERGPKCVGAVL